MGKGASGVACTGRTKMLMASRGMLACFKAALTLGGKLSLAAGGLLGLAAADRQKLRQAKTRHIERPVNDWPTQRENILRIPEV